LGGFIFARLLVKLGVFAERRARLAQSPVLPAQLWNPEVATAGHSQSRIKAIQKPNHQE
jgi:hypothetical protein